MDKSAIVQDRKQGIKIPEILQSYVDSFSNYGDFFFYVIRIRRKSESFFDNSISEIINLFGRDQGVQGLQTVAYDIERWFRTYHLTCKVEPSK